ncbi:PQQ-dependent sugar dehydrogenase [Streptomyces sp. XM4193]|uniref:PQQ-dependent sugar dehydrogenase n=1 Tax=Streptomyces sp. XM4193 TaxID=2929782 RepID=UPI001FF84A8F|nr:PQQ-dependent sugar dehydrogenase [Streptomyces sp. XM4193]MCK1797649.1 PQQ-dependent sugar dehydrogenase [Streptomyces sp. XM4193]
MRRSGSTALLAAAVMLAATACAGGPAAKDEDGEAESPPKPSEQQSSPEAAPEDSPSADRSLPPAKGKVEVTTTVATGLDSPWGLAALPEGDLLVSSRDSGKIVRVDGESGKKTELGEVPGVEAQGEGGLLGLAVKDNYVYAYYTSASDNRIVRMLYNPKKSQGQQLGAPSKVFSDLPKSSTHNGGRIAFGPDEMLYVGTGDAGAPDRSQDKESPAGKILRMQPDGSPPEDGNAEDESVVLSLGHRNVQGLAWDREKRLWASEFGQNEWDELNLVKPGKNYGWPEVEGENDGEQSGFTDPVAQWTTDEASPSGLAWAKGSLWMAGLGGERLWRIPLDGEKPLAEPEAFLEGDHGRLRTVVSDGSDGLWLVTSNTDGRGDPKKGDDRILKLKVR